MNKNNLKLTMIISLAVLLASPVALAADGASSPGDYVLTLKDHAFSPQDLVIPANQKVKLVVKNMSAASAEFESSELNREKVVPAHDEVTLFIGPLKPGTYKYFDDFNRQTVGKFTVQ